VRALHRHGLVGSMGRVGAAGDNAAMESFFSLLQNNVLDRKPWATRHELRIAIVTWIERTYHRRRRQSRLGRLTPIEFRDHDEHPGSTRCLTHHLSPNRAAGPGIRFSAREICETGLFVVTGALSIRVLSLPFRLVQSRECRRHVVRVG